MYILPERGIRRLRDRKDLNEILNFLWRTDKMNLKNSGFMHIYISTKVENMKFTFSVSHKMFKNSIQKCFHVKKEKRAFYKKDKARTPF